MDKRLSRLLSKPNDFTYKELKSLLNSLGYEEESGKGSGVMFYHGGSRSVIRLHKPHPRPELKSYQIRDVIDKLREDGSIQ